MPGARIRIEGTGLAETLQRLDRLSAAGHGLAPLTRPDSLAAAS